MCATMAVEHLARPMTGENEAGCKGKECARCQNTITDKLTAKAVGPKTNTQHLENTEACNSLSYHRGQHTTTQTHGAYGAVQAGGHLSVLVAVNGRVPTAASLGGSSGRGRCRGVTLQAIRERLPCPVICKKKRSHMHYPVRGACTASGSMLRSAVPCLCLARTFYGGRDGKRVKAGPRARKEGYQNPSIVYTHNHFRQFWRGHSRHDLLLDAAHMRLSRAAQNRVLSDNNSSGRTAAVRYEALWNEIAASKIPSP